jgi:hypothetical protein
MDRTVKIPAYTGENKQGVPQDNLTKEQKLALELNAKTTQLEEEKNKALEHQRTIERLRESLMHEQAKAAELARNSALQENRIQELLDALGKIAAIASQSKSV